MAAHWTHLARPAVVSCRARAAAVAVSQHASKPQSILLGTWKHNWFESTLSQQRRMLVASHVRRDDSVEDMFDALSKRHAQAPRVEAVLYAMSKDTKQKRHLIKERPRIPMVFYATHDDESIAQEAREIADYKLVSTQEFQSLVDNNELLFWKSYQNEGSPQELYGMSAVPESDKLADTLTAFLGSLKNVPGDISEKNKSAKAALDDVYNDLVSLQQQRQADLDNLEQLQNVSGGVLENAIVYKDAPHIPINSHHLDILKMIVPDVVAALRSFLELELTPSGNLMPEDVQAVEVFFNQIPQFLKEDSEIYSPHMLVRRLQETYAIADGSTKSVPSSTENGLQILQQATEILKGMKVDDNGTFVERVSVARCQEELSKLPPSLKTAFINPLGGLDARGFAWHVARLSASLDNLSDFVSSLNDGYKNLTDPLVYAQTVNLWNEVPEICHFQIPHTAAFAESCRRRLLALELEALLPTIDLEHDWAIEGVSGSPFYTLNQPVQGSLARTIASRDIDSATSRNALVDNEIVRPALEWASAVTSQDVWAGSALRPDVKKFITSAQFFRGIVPTSTGEGTTPTLSEKDRVLVEEIRATLPADLNERYPTADVLYQAAIEVLEQLDTPRTKHDGAYEEYARWQRVRGLVPVPLEAAYNYFVNGQPLLSRDEILADVRYTFPNNVNVGGKKPRDEGKDSTTASARLDTNDIDTTKNKKKDDTRMSKQRQDRWADRYGDEEDKLLEQPKSTAHFTGRSGYYRVLVELERKLDILNNFEFPVDPALEAGLKAKIASSSQMSMDGRAWLKIEDMNQVAGITLSTNEYKNLIRLLNEAWNHQYGGLIRNELEPYMREKITMIAKANKSRVHPGGWVRTIGRRKNSVASVKMTPGTGIITVNGEPLANYFSRVEDRSELLRPLEIVNQLHNFDIHCSTNGGGMTGQAGACRLGISRGLLEFDSDLREVLKPEKFLRRDPRMVERKKPGQKKARKKFQWVKR